MPEKVRRKINFLQIIFVFAIFAIIIVVFLKFSDLNKIANSLVHIHPFYVATALVIQIFTYISVVLLLKALLRIHRTKIKFSTLLKSVLSMNFLNFAFPSGGLSGTSFLFYVFSKEKIKHGTSAVTVALYYLVNNLSFYFFLVTTVVYLILKREINLQEYIASIFGLLFTIILTVGIYLFFRKKELFAKILRWIFRLVNRITKRFIKREVVKETEAFEIIKDFYIGWSEVKTKKKRLYQALAYAILVHIFDIFTIYILFIAFNYHINIPVLIIGFVIADLFSFTSFVPSGLAIFEISLAAIYTGFGIPFELAVIVVLIFRFFSLWLPIPIGAWAYQSLIKKTK